MTCCQWCKEISAGFWLLLARNSSGKAFFTIILFCAIPWVGADRNIEHNLIMELLGLRFIWLELSWCIYKPCKKIFEYVISRSGRLAWNPSSTLSKFWEVLYSRPHPDKMTSGLDVPTAWDWLLGDREWCFGKKYLLDEKSFVCFIYFWAARLCCVRKLLHCDRI